MQPTPSIPTMACRVAQLQSYQLCFAQRCSSFSGPVLLCVSLRYKAILSAYNLHQFYLALIYFVLLRCATELNSFGSVCQNCLLFHATAFVSCGSIPASQLETNYGLLMLSRKELTNTNVSPYNPASQFRGYLEASVSKTTSMLSSQIMNGHCKIMAIARIFKSETIGWSRKPWRMGCRRECIAKSGPFLGFS